MEMNDYEVEAVLAEAASYYHAEDDEILRGTSLFIDCWCFLILYNFMFYLELLVYGVQ